MASMKSRLKEKIAGDLQVKSDEEMRQAFPHGFKGVGGNMVPSRALKFRRERMVGDGGEGVMAPQFKREVYKDEVV